MEEIVKLLKKFVEERNWKKYHTPKNLAISMAIEAAELLEHFQWKNPSFEEIRGNDAVVEEVADIMIYAILFLNYMGEDVEKAIFRKMERNEERYPPGFFP